MKKKMNSFSSSFPILIIIYISIIVVYFNDKVACARFIPISHIHPNTSSSGWDGFTNLSGCKKGMHVSGLTALKHYFQKFGYLNATYSNFDDDFDDSLESAVRTYQLNFNLNSTGQLDPRTLSRVVQPRCGYPDLVNGSSTMRPSNSTVVDYAFFPDAPRWPPERRQLTYAFVPGNQINDAVRAVFSRAFQRWSRVTTLGFSEATSINGSDIRIGFYRGDHGDEEPFDGVLGTLAHAFAPTAGLCHMDGDENWVIDGNFQGVSPIDMESVAVHEIGHLLGLHHSSVEEAIMYPSISSGVRKVDLANDDISGIQALYGSKPN